MAGRHLVIAVALAGIAGCAPTQAPNPNTPPPTIAWSLRDATTGGPLASSGQNPNFTVLIHPQGTYQIGFSANSPDGITEISWSGTGTFYCYSGTPANPTSGVEGIFYGQRAGSQPAGWPTQAFPVNPPSVQQSLTNTFVVPCSGIQGPSGPGYADPLSAGTGGPPPPESQVTVMASATNASGKTAKGTLTLTVDPVLNDPAAK